MAVVPVHEHVVPFRDQVMERAAELFPFKLDARLAEPHYYAQFLNAMRYIFAHPEILERSPSRVVEDIG